MTSPQPMPPDIDTHQPRDAQLRALATLKGGYPHGQLAMLGSKLALWPKNLNITKSSCPWPLLTATEVASALGVSRTSIANAKWLRQHAVPELIEAVEHGRITVGAAMEIAASPVAEQLSLTQRAVSLARGVRRRQAVVSTTFRRTTLKPLTQRYAKTVLTLGHTVDILGELVEAAEAVDLVEHLPTLHKARATLARAIHHIEKGSAT